MKIRLMGVSEELDKFVKCVKAIPGIDIVNISNEYPNRGISKEYRVYIECKLDTVYTPAEVVTNLLEVQNDSRDWRTLRSCYG